MPRSKGRGPSGRKLFIDSGRETIKLLQNLFTLEEPAAPQFLWDALEPNGLISRFLSSTCTEVSGVENIGQCGSDSFWAHFNIVYLLTYLLYVYVHKI